MTKDEKQTVCRLIRKMIIEKNINNEVFLTTVETLCTLVEEEYED